MKSKNKIEKTEKAIEFAGSLKANLDILKGKGIDVEFIKTFEMSVRKLVKLQTELIALKEKVRAKKELIEQAREIAIEQSKIAREIAKDIPEVKKAAKLKKVKVDSKVRISE